MLLLAIIPTIIHNYVGSKLDDGKSVTMIDQMLGGFKSKPTDRNPGWGLEIFDSDDWVERIYSDPQGTSVRFFAARSYNQKRLYHHPEIALSRGMDLRRDGVVLLPGDPGIPVHLFRRENGIGLVGYVLLYDGEYVESPILQQIKSVLDLMFSSRKPMTLFYASDTNVTRNMKFEQTAVSTVLQNSIMSFHSANSETGR